MQTIHQQFKELGIEISGHYSDLYVDVTPETKKIVEGYEYKCNVTTFKSQVSGKMMFDIPFANDDYWKVKQCKT
jgi:hypothetical protein